MEDVSVICSNPSCGYQYRNDESAACPNCGATARTSQKEMQATVSTHASLRGRHWRPGFPGPLVNFVERTKLSRFGKLVRESLRFNRTDAYKTVKTHHVEERQPDSSWKVVHDEQDEYPAKRRPDSDY
jgi:hypothetical protein